MTFTEALHVKEHKMASNTIIQRVKTELEQYPPFNQLGPDVLKEFASKILVQYYQEGEIIFKKGDDPKPYSFIVIKGSVNLTETIEGEDVLIDVCDEGDIFGVRHILAHDNYYITAKVAEESLIYAVPVDEFKRLIETDSRVALFFAAEFASGLPEREYSLAHSVTLRKAFSNNPCKQAMVENDTLVIHPTNKVVTCSPNTTIQQAAKIMAERNVGSIIISNDQNHPLGIITDTDLRKKVVAVEENVKLEPVSTIMSAPVYTVEKGKTVADLIILMMKTNLRHFCVTSDGSQNSPIEGIISEHDVVTAEGNNPAVIIKEMMQASEKVKLSIVREKAEELLLSYLQQEVGIHFIANVITEINDALISRAMDFAIQELEAEGMHKPQIRFCWLSLGSEGRKEQLLRTDQDNAILYDNPPSGEEERIKTYFLKLGEKVTQTLIDCGFKLCPADIMASNTAWNQSLSGWENVFEKWILSPDPKAVMHSTIFFDFRPVYGDVDLAEELKMFVLEMVQKGRGFLTFFAQNALQNPPPLSFFRNFIVESSGKHANEFDIKSRTMMPLCDGARLLAFELGVKDFLSTFERFEKIAAQEPQLAELAKESGMAYEILMRLRAQNGLRNQNSGRYINPKALNKLERQALRNIFKTIETLQSTINLRYQLDYLRA